MDIMNEVAMFKDYLTYKGKKVTWERLDILKIILKRDEHFIIDDIVRVTESSSDRISRATVYRTVKMQEQSGILKYVRTHENKKVFEVKRKHHDHLICEHCGAIIDVSSEKHDTLLESICAQYDFIPAFHMLHIYGICKKCSQSVKS